MYQRYSGLTFFITFIAGTLAALIMQTLGIPDKEFYAWMLASVAVCTFLPWVAVATIRWIVTGKGPFTYPASVYSDYAVEPEAPE
jgi:hypothetical protein